MAVERRVDVDVLYLGIVEAFCRRSDRLVH